MYLGTEVRSQFANLSAEKIATMTLSVLFVEFLLGFLKEFHIPKCSYGIPLRDYPWTFQRRSLPVLLQECLSNIFITYHLTVFMGCLLEFLYKTVADISPSLDFSEVLPYSCF